MNTSLALIKPEELETIQRTGKMLAASGYFDAKGDSIQAVAMMATKILAGREIGVGPFAAVNGIYIINGRPSLGANLMAAAVKGSGRYDYRVREMTADICRIEFFQKADSTWESLGVSEFTAKEATKAGTKNMDKFPKNMLFARAMSNGVRFYTPDVFNGNAVYVPEELGADVNEDGEPITTATWQEVPAQRQPTQADVPPPAADSFAAIPNATESDNAIATEAVNIAAGLSSPQAAQLWAIDGKWCSNTHHAQNRWAQLAKTKFNNKVTSTNLKAVIVAFVEDCLSKPKVKIEAQPETV